MNMFAKINWVCGWVFIVFMLTWLVSFSVHQNDQMEDIKKDLKDLRTTISRYEHPYISMEDTMEQTTPKVPYKIKRMRVSAYCPCELCCRSYSDYTTSTGKNAFTKGVAVDPKVISYGTILDIPEYGKVQADDCGGAIKGNRLDVRFNTHQEALNWGVKYLDVKITKEQ